MPSDPAQVAILEEELSLVRRLLAQQRGSKNKLYSLHESRVVSIARGKAHKPYEGGCKVSVVGMRALPGNPGDGHTLAVAVEPVERLSGQKPEQCIVDQGD